MCVSIVNHSVTEEPVASYIRRTCSVISGSKQMFCPSPLFCSVIDQYFADLSVMIGDTQEVGDFLDKCKRAYEIPDDGSGTEIYTMQRAFYFMKRAVDRKAIILLQKLNPKGKRRQFEKV